uniref:Uncharacterized protein n=1 Tax=Rhipicephalus zambeziensis TaxID=60191 RepID=A0A224YL86_9ACAR
MMHVFRRDIVFLLGFIFLVYITAQAPTCVLAGLGSSKNPPKSYLTVPPRNTNPHSRYPTNKIPQETTGRPYPSPVRQRPRSPPRSPPRLTRQRQRQ